MHNYVAGFLFRARQTEVALVRKNKPDWQKGKLNGIGGKIEPGETEYAAMVREFREETGREILDWTPVATLTVGDTVIHFFRSFSGNDIDLPSANDVGERLEWQNWSRLVYGVAVDSTGNIARILPNLCWLVPMAADSDMPYGEIKSGFSGK